MYKFYTTQKLWKNSFFNFYHTKGTFFSCVNPFISHQRTRLPLLCAGLIISNLSLQFPSCILWWNWFLKIISRPHTAPWAFLPSASYCILLGDLVWVLQPAANCNGPLDALFFIWSRPNGHYNLQRAVLPDWKSSITRLWYITAFIFRVG